MQPDTIVPNLYNPQSLNRFSYVTNNPIRYTDPTGHYLVEDYGNGGCSTSGYCPGSSTCTPPPPGGGGNNNGGNGGILGGESNNDEGSTAQPSSSPGEGGSGATPYCNSYGLFNCAIPLPDWNLPALDLYFIRLRLIGQQTLIYDYLGESPLTISYGSVSLGGTDISYDGLETNLSGPSFTYIGTNANIEVSTFSGFSMGMDSPLGLPVASMHFGADVEIVTEDMYFSENIRIEFSGRPVEIVLIPITYYIFQSSPQTIFAPSY